MNTNTNTPETAAAPALRDQDCDVFTKPSIIEKGALALAMQSAKGAFQREILEGYHFLSMHGQKYGANNAQSYANMFARLQADARLNVREIRGKHNVRTLIITHAKNEVGK